MSVIINGKFYPDKSGSKSLPLGNQTLKRWNHDMQRRDHAGDVLQRYVHGKPSGEWIRMYPEEAKVQFSEQEIRKYGNSYGSDQNG